MTAPSPPKTKGWLRLVTVPLSLLLILATIVVGQEIIRRAPDYDSGSRPYVHTGGIGDTVDGLTFSVVVASVSGASTVRAGFDEDYRTDGVFVAVRAKVTAHSEAVLLEHIAVVDRDGRVFVATPRFFQVFGGYYRFQPAVPIAGEIIFEVPRDAASGLVVAAVGRPDPGPAQPDDRAGGPRHRAVHCGQMAGRLGTVGAHRSGGGRVKRGWWRRNVWGLVLLLPLLAGLVGLNGHLIYVRNYAERPSEPVPVDATGKATLDDYAVRVIELAPVENEQELKRLRPFDSPGLPDSVKVWRLILSVEAPADSFVGQCGSGCVTTPPVGPSRWARPSSPGTGRCGPPATAATPTTMSSRRRSRQRRSSYCRPKPDHPRSSSRGTPGCRASSGSPSSHRPLRRPDGGTADGPPGGGAGGVPNADPKLGAGWSELV